MSKYNRRLLRRSIQEQISSIVNSHYKYEDGNTHYIVKTPVGDAVIDMTNQPHLEASIDALPTECFLGVATKQQVFDAIVAERNRQDEKWGVDRVQSLPGFLLVMESELEEAKRGWQKNLEGKSAPLNEVVQLAAVCFACLEAYGLTGNAFATADIPDPQPE